MGDLFDDDLHLLCVISIFATFLIGLSQILTNTVKNFAITFDTFYISTCIIKSLKNGENVKLIALTVFEI